MLVAFTTVVAVVPIDPRLSIFHSRHRCLRHFGEHDGGEMIRILLLAAGLTAAFAATAVAAGGLPKRADKALYCGHVYLEAARSISSGGDPAAARIIRAYGKEWLSYSYGLAVGYSRREVNALKPAYEKEAKADVAMKRYRYKDCGSNSNLN